MVEVRCSEGLAIHADPESCAVAPEGIDLWAEQWRLRHAKGDMIIVRYADDQIVGFQHRSDAERFLSDLKERLAAFALSLHPETTRLIEFGRYAAERRAERGQGKPETFDFLGLTHYCSTGKDGTGFQLGRKTQRKRMRAKLREIKEKLRQRRQVPIDEQGQYLGTVIRGHFAYFAVPTNTRLLSAFRYHISIMWFQSLRRRSQRHRLTWERMCRIIARFLPSPRVLAAPDTAGLAPLRRLGCLPAAGFRPFRSFAGLAGRPSGERSFWRAVARYRQASNRSMTPRRIVLWSARSPAPNPRTGVESRGKDKSAAWRDLPRSIA
jgi:hypothetical protein